MYNENTKTFKIWDYKNCSFIVSHYITEPNAIAIVIQDNDTSEIVTKCTIYDISEEYRVGMATIKNYSENKEMTEFLKNLGIVTNIIESHQVNEMTEDTETIDVCNIDLKKLKEYSIEWHYNEESEEN